MARAEGRGWSKRLLTAPSLGAEPMDPKMPVLTPSGVPIGIACSSDTAKSLCLEGEKVAGPRRSVGGGKLQRAGAGSSQALESSALTKTSRVAGHTAPAPQRPRLLHRSMTPGASISCTTPITSAASLVSVALPKMVMGTRPTTSECQNPYPGGLVAESCSTESSQEPGVLRGGD
jgi:hypothetical protein